MRPVAEADIFRDTVDADPLQLSVRLRGAGNLLNVRTILLNGGMALHANRRLGDRHHFTRVRVHVALLAGELQISGVPFVAKGDGLLGSLRRLRDEGEGQESQQRSQDLAPSHERLIISPQTLRNTPAATTGSAHPAPRGPRPATFRRT